MEITAADSPFYIVVEHRNHLAAMSPMPVAVANGVLSFDFTTSPAYSNGGEGQIELSPNLYALWSGDLTSDGRVDAADRSTAWNLRNQSGYLNADVDLDGFVNASDRSIAWNRRNRATQVP